MPVTKSAQKKLRKDIKRARENKKVKNLLRSAIKKAIKIPTEKSVRESISLADKAAERNIIHKNKAARIKSKLAKLISKKTTRKKTVSTSKKSS